MTGRLIETDADIDEGLAALGAMEPRFAAAHALTGRPPLRRRPGGHGALLRLVCGQQLSVASADAVWSRLAQAGAEKPSTCAALSDQDLLDLGLSRPKVRTFRAVTDAALDYDALAILPEDDAIAALTAIHGIGPWTAHVYLMVCVGRADVFAPGDLALQEAARVLFELDERPTAKALAAMATAWSPWRAVAARLLWSYYRTLRGKDGLGG